jgi:hypothetical protein
VQKIFTTKEQIFQEVREILNNPKYCNDSVKVSPSEEELLIEIFRYHPRSTEKLADLKSISVGINNEIGHKGTKCFFIHKKSGDREEISYLKSCHAMINSIESSRGLSHFVEFPSAEKQRLSDSILELLVRLLNIYPLSKDYFMTSLLEKFPHKRRNEKCLVLFFMQLMRLLIVNS